MVRRRSASPRASGPVRSMPMRSAPAPVPVTRPAAAPARTPLSSASPPPAGGATRQPGLLGQMAATAGGVAIGSAVGHAVGNMFSGGGGGAEQQVAAPQSQEPTPAEKMRYSQPCEFEWRQFLECTQNQKDVSLCQGFNDLFKECKDRYGA